VPYSWDPEINSGKRAITNPDMLNSNVMLNPNRHAELVSAPQTTSAVLMGS